MASRFILPFADVGNGISPNAGAQLFFFDTGTSTPRDTFSDQAATTPTTNPVIAGGDGVFPDIWIAGLYKVVLRDKNNVQIWEADPISEVPTSLNLASNYKRIYSNVASFVSDHTLILGERIQSTGYFSGTDGGGGTYEIVSGGTGTNDGGRFINLDNGFQAKLIIDEGNTIDIRQYGLIQDDVSEDANNVVKVTALFQASIALGHLTVTGKGTFFLTFYQDLTLFEATIVIDGYGITFISTEDYTGEPTAGSRKPIFAFLARRTIVRGLTVQTNTSIDTTVDTVKDFAHGLAFGGRFSDVADLLVIEDCVVNNCWQSGIVADYSKNCLIRNNRVQQAPGTGIFTTGITDTLEICGNTVFDTGDDCIFASYILTFTEFGAGTKTLHIHDNYCLRAGEKGIGWGGALTVLVENNRIERTHVDAIREAPGSTMHDTRKAIIRNNVINGVRDYAGVHGTPIAGTFGVITSTKVIDITIEENFVTDVTSVGTTNGIYFINGSTGVTRIAGNNVDMDSIGGTDGAGPIFNSAVSDERKVEIFGNVLNGGTDNGIRWGFAKRLDIRENVLTNNTGTSSYRLDNIDTAYVFDNDFVAAGLVTDTSLKTQYEGSVTYDPPNLSTGTFSSRTVTVTGASIGDFTSASFSNDPQGITLESWVSSSNTVTVRFSNNTGGSVDLASGTVRVIVNTP